MMIQMHNERSNAISLDWDLEFNWRWWRWIKHEEMREIAKRSRNSMIFDFAWPCEIFAQSCETLQEDENNAKGSSTSHHCAKLLGFMRKCIFSRFLDEEASEKPLRWCQVSTWPWPINKNLIDSFKDFGYISNCRTFQISSLYIILYFPSFSLIFSIAKHVLWDQISKHEWLNLLFFLGGWRI